MYLLEFCSQRLASQPFAHSPLSKCNPPSSKSVRPHTHTHTQVKCFVWHAATASIGTATSPTPYRSVLRLVKLFFIAYKILLWYATSLTPCLYSDCLSSSSGHSGLLWYATSLTPYRYLYSDCLSFSSEHSRLFWYAPSLTPCLYS